MNELCVEPLHCLLDEGEVRSSVKTKSLKEVGIEVDEGHEVSITKTGVKLESEEDKESGNSTGRPCLDLVSGMVLQRLISSLSRK